MFPKKSTYVKCCDGETKWMDFLIEDDELLKKDNDIWNKVSNSISKTLDCKPICNIKFSKTKLRSYGDGAKDFNTENTPKAGSKYI